MTVEFHLPQEKIKEWVIDFVKDKLIEFHHQDKEISRAEVYFKEHATEPDGDKVCEIDLTIYGSSFFVHRNAKTFDQASREAIKMLTEEIQAQIKNRTEPPDEVTSTVKV